MGEMITIPLDEYRNLKAAVDELADLRTYDRAMADIAAGRDELVPSEVAKRLVSGENPLRVWREFRGMTQAGLSGAAGVNRVQIADIEAGRKNGSVETVCKIAVALGVGVEDLV